MYSVGEQSIRFPQFLRLSISFCVASYCVLPSVPLRIQRFRTSALVIASFFLSYLSLSPRLVDLGYFAKPLRTRIKHLVDSLSLQLRTLPSSVSPYLFCLFLCCALHRLATPEPIIGQSYNQELSGNSIGIMHKMCLWSYNQQLCYGSYNQYYESKETQSG
jgi:hypothetical protein